MHLQIELADDLTIEARQKNLHRYNLLQGYLSFQIKLLISFIL